MLQRTSALRGKMPSQKGVMGRMKRVGKSTLTKKIHRQVDETLDGDRVLGKGGKTIVAASMLHDELQTMENPMVWIWYPWRRKPEPPNPSFPCPNALKNLHGAIYTDLTPAQKKREEQMMYGMTIPASRQANMESRHPFLAGVLKELEGTPKGFPFWYKKYPTRRHAYETRFNIPKEMLDGYPQEVKDAVAPAVMNDGEKRRAERSLYIEKYAQHDLDLNSPAVLCVTLALKTRTLRNHLLTNPHNNIAKFQLVAAEKNLKGALRRLRKIDFRQYWEIIRDHDVMDVVQPANSVAYRWGAYWQYDWNSGLAISTKISDFMDPRGMNGCIETGRSRAEVARDLGLSYTRTLSEREQKQLSSQARYFEHLLKFKTEQPEAWRERERRNFQKKFTGMFTKMTRKAVAPDFPSRFRGCIGTKLTRWKSSRHGPM
jgi:hypothetical protein